MSCRSNAGRSPPLLKGNRSPSHKGLVYKSFPQTTGPNGGAVQHGASSSGSDGARKLIATSTQEEDPATRIGAIVNVMSSNTQFYDTGLGAVSYNLFLPDTFSGTDANGRPCVSRTSAASAQGAFMYSSDKTAVQKSVSSSASIDASKFGVGVSASASFSSLTSNGEETTVSTYTTSSRNQNIQITAQCLNKVTTSSFDPTFLQAWNALPEDLDSNAAFYKYFSFVNGLGQFGTHFISKITTGAAYMYISRSKSSYSYSSTSMNTAICAGFKSTATSIRLDHIYDHHSMSRVCGKDFPDI